jgi:hypothetical protein
MGGESIQSQEIVQQPSRLCPACQSCFHGAGEGRFRRKHYFLLASLRVAAQAGCRLCLLLCSMLEIVPVHKRPDEEVEMSYTTDFNGIIFRYKILNSSYEAQLEVVFWTHDILEPRKYSEPDLSTETSSPESQKLAIQWFQQCTTSHKKCNSFENEMGWTPTRLLDLNSSTTTHDISLVETNNLASTDLSYMALSHCWGNSPMLTLQLGNLNEFRRAIEFKRLPKTFQDAILAVKWFDIRYLWIDSLCIIQDDTEDWRTESQRMKDVYKNAIGVIAATGGSSSSSGCFFARNPVAIQPFKACIIRGDGVEEFWCGSSNPWNDGIEEAPLSNRGW